MSNAILTYPLRTVGALRSALRAVLKVMSIAMISVIVLVMAGVSWELFSFFLVTAIFFAALCVARPLSGRTVAGARESFLSANLVIWIFLMVSGVVFIHNQTTASAAKGHVDPTALYQALSWILCFLALLFITCFRPAYLRRLFSGSFKWATIFAIVAFLSCGLSSQVLYSAALAFKLCVIVLTLCAMGEAIEDDAGIHKLFVALFAGMLIVVMAEFITPFLGPDPFAGGRLGAMIGLSGTCGILLLLSLLFLWLKKNPWFLLCAVFSVVVMMLAGTKGGMVASFASLMVFFFMLKRPAQAFVACLVFTIVFILACAFTPLGKSLQKYSESENASTLTGRTNLWNATWPEIKSHIAFGKGYRASRFLSEEVPGAFQEAGNMHNSFLEVLYNNGLAGLIPILIMNFVIVFNLKGPLLRPPTLRVRYYAVAAFALYTHLFVWGLVAVTFGGAPDDRFMIFFSVFLLSMLLRAQCDGTYRNTFYGQRSS